MAYSLDLINILVLIVLLLNLILGFFVYFTKRDAVVNKYFLLFSITATLWGVFMFLYRGAPTPEMSAVFARLLYASAALIPYCFIFFIGVFPVSKYNLPKSAKILLSAPFVFIIFISLMPGYLIYGTTIPLQGEKTIVFSFFYHTVYALYIMGYFSICYSLLLIKYFKLSGLEKTQTTYVMVGTFISTMIGVCTNLILPYLNDFSLNWMGQVGIVAMIVSISYSILRHKLFEIKIVATQFIVAILCFSLFARLLFSSSRSDLIINSVFLFITIIISILLLRSVVNEVNQRHKLEELTNNLEITNNNLAMANDRLKDLDQLKSEFLSLATHQIKGPLTSIKGYASLILEGDYGAVSAKVRGAVEVIFKSCQNLTTIVGDFLDISRIEQGRIKYDMVDLDAKKLVQDIITELKPNIANAKLSFELSVEENETYAIHADPGKMKQVIGNIIDNSIKYTPKGGIQVHLSIVEGNVRIAVKDTGIGISEEDIPKLFSKFIRTKDATKTNVVGTGLGLYVAKQMILAQGGKVWVESEGTGKGSTFYIEIPVKK